MLVDLRMAKAQAEYRRDQISRIYPKQVRDASQNARDTRKPRRPALKLRKAWSA